MRHHIIRVERVTLRKGRQAKDILQYYLIIPLHSFFNQMVFPIQHFTHDYELFRGRDHLLAAFVQPLKQWGHVLDEDFCILGMLMMPRCSQEGQRRAPLLRYYSTTELKVCLLVSLIPSWWRFGHSHLRMPAWYFANSQFIALPKVFPHLETLTNSFTCMRIAPATRRFCAYL